jgi:hypothetical protein
MSAAKADGHETRVEKWAAISGKWKFTKTLCRYEGPSTNQPTPHVGLARASNRFRDGTICVHVKLSKNQATTGGVFLRFQSTDSPYGIAAIGAYDAAYAISEYYPGAGWVARARAGSLTNLNVADAHDMKVSVMGQSVRLTVDDVDVLTASFSSPFEGTGLGLFAFEDAPVEFTDARIVGTPPSIFVMMPFAEPFDTLYREVINPVARGLGFEVVRVDEVVGPGVIIDDIQRQIESSHAVVAEISTQNPNVFYELGYARALRKPAILLVRRANGSAMPFDIRGYRAIFYDDSIGGKRTVERNLEQHLKAILGS